MGPESVILLMISAWFRVAAAMLWGLLRIARRHVAYDQPKPVLPVVALRYKRKPQRPKLPKPLLSPAYRAAHHFAHR